MFGCFYYRDRYAEVSVEHFVYADCPIDRSLNLCDRNKLPFEIKINRSVIVKMYHRKTSTWCHQNQGVEKVKHVH